MIKCNDHSLEALLDADDASSEYRDVVDHVESCQHCQERLGQLAAEADDWHEAKKWLSNGIEAEDDDRPWSRHGRRRSVAWSESMASQLLSPPTHPEMLGRIGRYDVERLIGAGGMGVVFKAFDTELNRPVAVKVLSQYLAVSGAARKRFAREARAAAAVVNEHVVAIHNVESDGEAPFLVMQYVAGESLQARLDRCGPLEVREILRIGMQTAAGLAAAHAQGLVHRDVKPSNILLQEGVDRALLTDFGLARAGDDASLTHTGYHPGTPQYMSPEQARGESVDQRSDLFSLGSVMYAMCTGRAPFRAETSYGVLRRITDEEPRPIREIGPDIPEWLCSIVGKLISKQPVDRFDSAGAVAVLLENCLAHVQQPSTTPLPESVKQLSQLLPTGKAGRKRQLGQRFHKPTARTVRLIQGAVFGLAMICAGILIVLELNKGKLTIESEADNVPVRIMQGERVVEKLTVTRSGASVRVAAGQYVVEIDGPMDGLAIENGTVKLQRQGREVVRLVQEDHVSSVEVEHRRQGTGDTAKVWPKTAASHDGHLIAKLTLNDVTISDAPSGKVVAFFRMEVSGKSITFSDDETELAVVTAEGVRYYGARSAKLLRFVAKQTQPEWPAQTSADGDTLKGATDAHGEQQGDSRGLRKSASSQDGRLTAHLYHNFVGGVGPHDFIEIVETETGKLARIVHIHEVNGGKSIEFSDGGQVLAFFTDDGVRYYDVRSGHLAKFTPKRAQ